MLRLPIALFSTLVLSALPTLWPSKSQPAEHNDLAPPTAEAATAVDPDIIVLEPGEHDVHAIIHALETIAECNVLSHNAGKNRQKLGAVTVENPITLTPDSVWVIAENLLYSLQYGILPLAPEHKLFELVDLSDDNRARFVSHAAQLSEQEILSRPQSKRYVQCAILLKNMPALQATNYIRGFYSTGSRSSVTLEISAAGTERSLLIRGMTDQVAAAIQVVREVDKATPPLGRAPEETLQQLIDRVQALEAALKSVQGK